MVLAGYCCWSGPKSEVATAGAFAADRRDLVRLAGQCAAQRLEALLQQPRLPASDYCQAVKQNVNAVLVAGEIKGTFKVGPGLFGTS